MKRLVIELSDEEHKRIKTMALLLDKTMKQFVLDILTKETKKEQSR